MSNDVNAYAQALMNEIAVFANKRISWIVPYRTGALARGIADVGEKPNGAEFNLLTQFTQYGAILNEFPIIHYTLHNPKTGRVHEGAYVNKHYGWVENTAQHIANDILINFPNVRML